MKGTFITNEGAEIGCMQITEAVALPDFFTVRVRIRPDENDISETLKVLGVKQPRKRTVKA
jgi:hypothetical protein